MRYHMSSLHEALRIAQRCDEPPLSFSASAMKFLMLSILARQKIDDPVINNDARNKQTYNSSSSLLKVRFDPTRTRSQ